MKLLYMNQAGNGEWGAIQYSQFDVIMLAESAQLKANFSRVWDSKSDSLPVMSVQTAGTKRLISSVSDLDFTAQQVRPLVTFSVVGGDAVRVVFVHLKSGNEAEATTALNAAVDATLKSQFGVRERIVWIGDFNRAKPDHLQASFQDLQLLARGGGQASWYLDRAYASGDWSGYALSGSIVSVASDNGHAGICVEFQRK